MQTVKLQPVSVSDTDIFFGHYEAYAHELSVFGQTATQHELELYRTAVLEEAQYPPERELFWVEVDAVRVGFVITRCFPDWPDETILKGSISEFCIFTDFRRMGYGSGAVDELLKLFADREVREVEADILNGNQPAIEFWQKMGFAIRFLGTSRPI